MPTAAEVASKLRQMADALDKTPDLEVGPYLSIHADTKETFLELAKHFPRPAQKKVEDEGYSWAHFTLRHDFMRIDVPRKQMCILVEPARPARYECPSIFSAEEEEALGTF